MLTKSIILVEISGKNEADYLFSTEYLNFKLKNESKFLFKMAYLGILKHVKISNKIVFIIIFDDNFGWVYLL